MSSAPAGLRRTRSRHFAWYNDCVKHHRTTKSASSTHKNPSKKRTRKTLPELTLFLGADHGGFAVKEEVKSWLLQEGYLIADLGASTYVPDDDYPTYGIAVAEAVSADPSTHRGILFCRSGEGMAIVANRFSAVRASIVFTPREARETRDDNDANVLSIPADYLSRAEIREIITTWLTTPFSGKARHKRRIRVLSQLGTGVYCC